MNGGGWKGVVCEINGWMVGDGGKVGFLVSCRLDRRGEGVVLGCKSRSAGVWDGGWGGVGVLFIGVVVLGIVVGLEAGGRRDGRKEGMAGKCYRLRGREERG